MATGKIGVTSENIFPVIKKFLYSEQEIFLRELVSNAVDATQKIKALSRRGEFTGELGELKVTVSVDKENKTITITDRGIGMTKEEVEKYINQIAFSGANEFLDKYKDSIDAIIGHFGLGFYSAFMVSEKVEIKTKSWKDAPAVRWACDGSPEYEMEEIQKEDRGTEIILHVDQESVNYLEDSKIEELLKKYCMFLPIAIFFKDNQINDTEPVWTKKPSEVKDEDYKAFYKKLYPGVFEDPLFNIHINVDYPFNLTGVLYFPKIRTNLEIQKNKIQLYCNQVFVTDNVEGIVPDFLTLLHGVLDSPDIPLNVSRSYLQGDSNVKKISSHITKKVADKLSEIFKNQREDFEKKWDDLRLFIQYGMLTEEKFYEQAKNFFLLKNLDGKYFTIEEYKNIVKDNQTDKNNNIVFLYAANKDEQYTFIEAAKSKGYDVLVMDGVFDAHFVNQMESKMTDIKFFRVDSDTIDKLIQKADAPQSKLDEKDKTNLTNVFDSQTPKNMNMNFMVMFDAMGKDNLPVVITRSEFMRRMKDMGKMGGPEASFYNNLPDSLNLVVNEDNQLIQKIITDMNNELKADFDKFNSSVTPLESDLEALNALTKDKKDEEISQEEKDKKADLQSKIDALYNEKSSAITAWASKNNLVKQVIDLGLLANNLLKGEALNNFVKRSVEMIG